MKIICLLVLLLGGLPSAWCFGQQYFPTREVITSTNNSIDSIESLQQLEAVLSARMPDLHRSGMGEKY